MSVTTRRYAPAINRAGSMPRGKSIGAVRSPHIRAGGLAAVLAVGFAVANPLGVFVASPLTQANGAPAGLSAVARRTPRLVRTLAAAHSALFLRTGGLAGANWFGMPILVLETVGRRSGKHRTTPVVYLPDGDNLVVVAANGGNQVPPDWWLNLRAAGECVAILGQERRRVTPHEATGAERARLWRHFAGRTPVEHYQGLTPRRIPVVVLAPATNPVHTQRSA